jgi:ankyrin repeat protein
MVDVNLATKKGYAPLHVSAVRGDTVVLRLLLCAEGIDINRETIYGDTPLILAIRCHEAVKLLLGSRGVNLHKKGALGKTALAFAEGAVKNLLLDYLYGSV